MICILEIKILKIREIKYHIKQFTPNSDLEVSELNICAPSQLRSFWRWAAGCYVPCVELGEKRAAVAMGLWEEAFGPPRTLLALGIDGAVRRM